MRLLWGQDAVILLAAIRLASWVRLEMPSFRKTLATWYSTVLVDRNSAAASAGYRPMLTRWTRTYPAATASATAS